jgi:hypothetical protein
MAGLALLTGSGTWVSRLVASPAPLPPVHLVRTGAQVAPWGPALALVALAGAGALLATRGAGRLVVAGLIALSGLGVAAAGGYGLIGVAHTRPAWPLACLLVGLAMASLGGWSGYRGARWPSMGSRYERPARPAAGAAARLSADPDRADPRMVNPPAAAAAMWDALDRGEDPSD